jgi:MbtH protein
MMNIIKSENEDEDYTVVVNEEGQYSLWQSFREAPAGWFPTGAKGKRSVCLDWIQKEWTDMRPRSLVAAIEKAEAE